MMVKGLEIINGHAGVNILASLSRFIQCPIRAPLMSALLSLKLCHLAGNLLDNTRLLDTLKRGSCHI